MKSLLSVIIKISGFVFGALVVGFTATQTWSLLHNVSSNAVTATVGLILFEGGMLYWWFVFQNEAEGIGQMAVSLVAALLGLILVVGSTGLHLGAVEGGMLGENTPARLVLVAAVVNLICKFAFPLLSPEMMNNIWTRALEGKISLYAFRDAEAKTADMAAALADEVGAEIVRRVKVDMLSSYGLIIVDNDRVVAREVEAIEGGSELGADETQTEMEPLQHKPFLSPNGAAG